MLLALVLAQVLQPADPRGPIFTNPATMWQPLQFEALPPNGRGTFGVCSTTSPTGAQGQTLVFGRAGSGVCTKTAAGGYATSGIGNGDLVEISGPRVEFNSLGVLSYRAEAQGINLLPRFIELTNGLWADVGTPTLTGSQASPFTGTFATSAVLMSDNDGAAFEGRSQVVTVTAGSAYYGFCYLKAGTATSARIVLDGTAATITGLTSTTWSIVEVADASASAAAITLELDVGSTAAATGDLVAGGCDVKLGVERTSIVPTTTAAATRNEDIGYYAATLAGPILSLGVTVQQAHATATASRVLLRADNGGATAFSTQLLSTAAGAYVTTQATGSIEQTTVAVGSWTTPRRLCSTRDGSTSPQIFVDGVGTAYTRIEGLGPVHTRIYFGGYSAAGVLAPANALLSNIKADVLAGKCP